MQALPFHLRKYIVNQESTKYTPVDHACWRFILRSLKNFHATHAHPSYLKGLEETGIEIDQIPSIDNISKKLEKFGWRALPVSGFIPPAAFMELQALNVLPIASDMRTLEHLQYTPAPDIVHEAAGHAPLLSNQEYADYLRAYAQVARKAIISEEDLNLYEAIRLLSDLKENPNSTPEQVTNAERKLEQVAKSITYISEASLLGRMNWWTAEYGLIGDLKNPKIFGAGLLSSVGESRWCLSNQVKKFPLTINCVETTYDITEPQPQLFVTNSFQHLKDVLNEFAKTMAYQTGGISGLEKAKKAHSVNTVQYNSGLQVSGILKNFLIDSQNHPSYLQFEGPCQLSFNEKELTGHSNKYHAQGFGSPVGNLKNFPDKCISEFNEGDWLSLGIKWDGASPTQQCKVDWTWTSGVTLRGQLKSRIVAEAKTIVLTFADCEVNLNGQKLFEPAWGAYDMAIGRKIISVFGGAADREAFGEVEDFVAARVSAVEYNAKQKRLHSLYQKIRDFRKSQNFSAVELQNVLTDVRNEYPEDWLLTLEIYELAFQKKIEDLQVKTLNALRKYESANPLLKDLIEEGLFVIQEN